MCTGCKGFYIWYYWITSILVNQTNDTFWRLTPVSNCLVLVVTKFELLTQPEIFFMKMSKSNANFNLVEPDFCT